MGGPVVGLVGATCLSLRYVCKAVRNTAPEYTHFRHPLPDSYKVFSLRCVPFFPISPPFFFPPLHRRIRIPPPVKLHLMRSSRTVRFLDDEEHIDDTTDEAPPDPDHAAVDPTAEPPVDVTSTVTDTPAPEGTQPIATSPLAASTNLPVAPAPLTDRLVHPALAFNRHLITLNFSQPIDEHEIDALVLSQDAISIPGPMEIICKGLPWVIIVNPGRDETHVTVKEVLEELNNDMQKTVTTQELRMARSQYGDAFIQTVVKAWKDRDPQQHGWTKRLDFLLGKNHFTGLDLDDFDTNRWRLHVI